MPAWAREAGSSWACRSSPGEFAKITVILMDAAVMARYGGNLDDPREYVKALGIMMVPFVCIMTQPDLGNRPGISVYCGVRPGHGRR